MSLIDWLALVDIYQYYLFVELGCCALNQKLETNWKHADGLMTLES